VTFLLCRYSLLVPGLAEEEKEERTNINLTFLIETSRDAHFLLSRRPLTTDQYTVGPATSQLDFFWGRGGGGRDKFPRSSNKCRNISTTRKLLL